FPGAGAQYDVAVIAFLDAFPHLLQCRGQLLLGVLGILPPNIAKTAGGPATRGLQGAISF
ncbi:MAG: hypothetical protein CL865_01800, partial [Cycloclasticus sp.]|nr:hypothetical protein [Cycloclasticus sp.]